MGLSLSISHAYSVNILSYFTELKMRNIVFLGALALVSASDDQSCYAHISEKCDEPGGNDWTTGTCSSVHGGFKGNSDNLHRIIVDDFTDSMNYLLMSTAFSTDKVNRMGFSKYFKDQSDKMWAKGKDMIKYVLKRGGKMGSGFQIPPFGANNQIGDFDYSNEMKPLGVNLDLMKGRASGAIKAYRHSLSSGGAFDPEVAHKLEELSEEYSGEINEIAKKINNLGKMVRNPSSSAMALHMFDKSLM